MRQKKKKITVNCSLTHLMPFFQLWILPAFGCRPQYDNGLEQETFGFSIWTTVLNFAIPLNLFYRMHSVASLFEVFRRVWRNSRWLSVTKNMHWMTCHNWLPTVSHSAGQPFRRQSGSHSNRPETNPWRQTKCRCIRVGITAGDGPINRAPWRFILYNLMPVQNGDEKTFWSM